MFAMLSAEDMQFILETQMPLVEAVDAKKRLLAKNSASSKKAVQEALAAIPPLPELTPADTTRLTDSARSCMKKNSCSYEEACVARSTLLLGHKCVLLWHPDELEMDAHMGCMLPVNDSQDMTGRGSLCMEQLAAMWAVWVMCNGGTVVASTASSSAGGGTLSGCPKHATKDSAGEFHLSFVWYQKQSYCLLCRLLKGEFGPACTVCVCLHRHHNCQVPCTLQRTKPE